MGNGTSPQGTQAVGIITALPLHRLCPCGLSLFLLRIKKGKKRTIKKASTDRPT